MSYTPLPPDSRSLLERVQAIWDKGLLNLPVHKDLPRLTGGFEIANGTTKQLIYKESGGDNRGLICQDILWTIATYFPDSLDSEEREKQMLAKQKQKQKVKSVQKYIADTHDEEEIFELSDNDDNDGDHLVSPAEQEQTIGDTDDSSDECDLEMVHVYQLSTRPAVFAGIATDNLYAHKLAAKYSQYVKSGDLGVHLQHFLSSGAINPNGKLAGILRCIQQEIICPPVMDLRMDIYPTLPYKDVKGTWYVRIELYFEEDEMKEEPDYSNGHLEGRSRNEIDLKTSVVLHTPPANRRRTGTATKNGIRLFASTHSSRESDEGCDEISSSPTKASSRGIARRFIRTPSLPVFEDTSPKEGWNRLTSSTSKIIRESPTRKLKSSSSKRIKRSLSKSQFASNSSLKKVVDHSSTSENDDDNNYEISYKPVKKIRVLHRKREQSYEEDPSSRVEFEWELALTFGPDVNCILDATLQLTDMYINDGVTKERKEELLNLFSSYMSKEFPYINIWKISCSKLLPAKEIQRSSQVTSVISHLQNKMIYEPHNNPKSSKGSTFKFVYSIGKELYDIIPHLLTSAEINFIDTPPSSDAHTLSKAVKHLISSYANSPKEEGPLGRLLKATCKEITVPASSTVKNLIPLTKAMKSVKGAREILIQFLVHTVEVSHFFRTMCTLIDGTTSDRFFVFEWSVKLTFNRNIEQLLSISYEVIEYSFSVNVSPLTKKTILESLSDWITTETVQSSQTSIPVETVIRCLSSALSKLPSGKEIIKDNCLPGGEFSAIALLDLLHESIVDQDLPSIPCTEIKQGGC